MNDDGVLSVRQAGEGSDEAMGDEGSSVIVALVACASTQRVWHKYLVD